MKAIGGYFGLEIEKKTEFYPDLLKVNSGRNALRLYLKEKNIKKLYIPFYICDSVIHAVKKEGVSIQFYKITKNFEPVLSDISDEKIHILCVNYFGICEDQILSLRNKFKKVIIDNSQAFFSKPLPKSTVFYSPRKFFGIPDGGYLYSDVNDNIKLDQDHSYDRALHLLIRHDRQPEKGYAEFSKNEKFFDKLGIKGMSNLTKLILCSIDYEKVKKIREENFVYLHERLSNINLIEIKPKYLSGPMVYPFMCDNKELRNYLIQRRIFCGSYWKEVVNRRPSNSVEYQFSQSIIALPIDQRFSLADMERIIHHIEYFFKQKQ
jgi:hypothetical protein